MFLAAVTQNRCLFRINRIALSMNSRGKSFHIEAIQAKQSSARQCWLVLACIASQYCTLHDNPTDWDLAT